MLGIALAGMVIAPSGYLKPIKDITYYVSSPFLSVGSRIGQSFFENFKSLKNLKDLEKRNKSLEEENRNLKAENAIMAEVRQQNEILKQELGFQKSREEKKELTPARIISYSPSGFLEYMTIDKGKRDKIQEGQAVVSQGYLVGRIEEVGENTSKVSSIIGGKLLVPVLLQESRGTGLLRGGLGGPTVSNIAVDAQIKTGEDVVTSGLGGTLPSGIIIGKIEKVTSRSSAILQSALIKSPLKFGKLQIVFVQR